MLKWYSELGRRLKQARERTGLTQAQVARLLGMPREMVSYYETGARKVEVETLVRLADVYGVDPRYFLAKGPEELESGTEASSSVAMAFRARGILEEDLPFIVEGQRLLRNLHELDRLLQGDRS